jgi:uncharacterized membrane protein YkoI
MSRQCGLVKHLLCSFLVLVLVAGCGGVSKHGDPPALSGTVTAGAPLADCTITVKDSNGVAVTGSTDAQGKFKIVLPAGLVPPLLLRVERGTGDYLYSAVAVAATARVNINSFTDLMVRTYYEAEGLDVDTTFDTLSASDPVLLSYEVELINEVENDVEEEEILLANAPQAVQDTILAEAGANVIEGIVEITVGDKTVYKVEWKESDKDVEMLVAADGKIIQKEKEVTIDDVPVPVKETILTEAGANEIKEIEVITQGDLTIYGAEWIENGKKIDLKVAPDGTIISKMSEEADEENGDNEENQQEGDYEG